MTNMNDEKEKLKEELKAKYNYSMPGSKKGYWKGWSDGFDAGVKAERERVKKLMNEQVEDGYDHNSMFITNALYNELFPQEQEK